MRAFFLLILFAYSNQENKNCLAPVIIQPSGFIDAGRYKNCDNFNEPLTINDDVTEIKDEAFYNCNRLPKVTISNRVDEIGDRVFFNCTGLKEVIFESDVLFKIGFSCFANCYNLRKLELPDSIKEMWKGSFSNCHNLETINIPSY